MTNSYTTPGPAGGAGQVLPDRKGIPRATSFFGCIFLKQVRRGRVPLSRAQARQHDAARVAGLLVRGVRPADSSLDWLGVVLLLV